MATIKFWSEMAKATSVDGQDKVMIGKNSNGEAMYVDFQYLVNQAGAQTSDYIPIDGNTLPTLGTESKFSIVGSGTYTQSVGGDVVVPENSLGIIVWDGDEWSLSQSVELPTQVADGKVEEGNDRAISGNTVWESDFVNRDKLSKGSASRNLFDKTAVRSNFLIDYDSGDIIPTSSPDRNVSDYIRVTAGSYYTSQGLSTNPVNQRISVFQNIGDTVAVAKMSYPTFQSPIDGYVVIDVSDTFLDTLQLEAGEVQTPYEAYIPVVDKLYEYDLRSKYAEKTTKNPVEDDDIVPYSIIKGLDVSTTIYRDVDDLFNLSSPNFDLNYESNSVLGYVRTIAVSGLIKDISFYMKVTPDTAETVTITVGKVPFTPDDSPQIGAIPLTDITVLGSVSVSKAELPTSAAIVSVQLPEAVTVTSGDNIVVYFDTPTGMPVFKTSTEGYYMIYRTTAAPTYFSYGHRKSSGIFLGYVNENQKKIIEDTVRDAEKDAFEGKRIVTIGDSITFHAGSWARILFSKYGENFLNLAISGCKFMDNVDTEINLDDSLPFNSKDNSALNQLLRLAQKLTPVGQEISISNPYRGETFTVPTSFGVGTGVFEQPDIIIVAMGTNDSVPATEGELFNILSTPLNDLDRTENMVTGMRFFTEYLIALCPNSQIIFSTPIQASWGSSRRYEITKPKRDRIIENCNYYAIPVIDAFIESGFSEKFEIQSSQGKYLSDGLHPDDNGKAHMARYMKKAIINLLYQGE